MKIHFLNSSQCIEANSGSTFLEVADRIPLKFGCKRGECGTCAIEVLEGAENLTKVTPEEVETLQRKGLGPGCRLACQCAVNGDVLISTCAGSSCDQILSERPAHF